MKGHRKAIDALRRARRALRCFDSGAVYSTCPAPQVVPLDASEAIWFSHAIAASLLLDGLSISDVTAAEEALDG